MDFSITEEQSMVKDLARQILRGLISDESRFEVEASEDGLHRAAWSALAEAGLLGVALPEAHGGMELGLLPLLTLLREVGRAAAPIPALPCLVAALAVSELGDESQQAALLDGLADGSRFLTLALSEPDSRSLRRPTTRASRVGGQWRLTGVKTAVPAAGLAHAALAPAMTADGPALFVVDLDAVTLEQQAGTDFAPLGLLTLDGAPATRLGPDDGPADGTAALDWLEARVRVGQCAVMLGMAEAALRLSAKYATTREQFGQPIGAFQAVSQRAGDAYIDVETMRVSYLQAAWRLSEGLPSARAIAIARYFASEGSHKVQAAAMHLHGGMGFDRDYVLHRYFLGAKALEFQLGSAASLLSEVGEGLKKAAAS